MKDVQCYELFGGIALKNHAFSFSIIIISISQRYAWGRYERLCKDFLSPGFRSYARLVLCHHVLSVF